MIDYLNNPMEYLQLAMAELYPDNDVLVRFNTSVKDSCVSYMDEHELYIIELSSKTSIEDCLAFATQSLAQIIAGDESASEVYERIAERYNEIALFNYSINGGGFSDEDALKYLALLNENEVAYTIDTDGSIYFKTEEDMNAARKLIMKV